MKIVHIVWVIILIVTVITSCENGNDISNKDVIKDDTLGKWEKGYKEYNSDIDKCGNYPFQQIFSGVFVGAVSKDKKALICFMGSEDSPFILRVEGTQISREDINFSSADTKDSTMAKGIHFPMFCPYDQNKIIFLSGVFVEIDSGVKEGYPYKHWTVVPQWCLYNLETKMLQKIYFVNQNLQNLTQNSELREIVHWSSKSVPGNDIFYVSNFKTYNLQTGKLEDGDLRKPLDVTTLRLVSVSPDEKKYFSVNNGNELYLNNSRLSHQNIIQELFSPFGIMWKYDSKQFSAQIPIHYNSTISIQSPAVYSVNNDNTITLSMSYNMLKKHCSMMPPGCPVFISDSSYWYAMYPNVGYYGDLYEFNNNGDEIRRITKYF